MILHCHKTHGGWWGGWGRRGVLVFAKKYLLYSFSHTHTHTQELIETQWWPKHESRQRFYICENINNFCLYKFFPALSQIIKLSAVTAHHRSALCRLSGVCLLPPQLFLLCVLEAHHAVFESLHLELAHSPVLVFSHALLHGVMQLRAARARYHPIHGVVLVLVFTAAVVGWRGGHPLSTRCADFVGPLSTTQCYT